MTQLNIVSRAYSSSENNKNKSLHQSLVVSIEHQTKRLGVGITVLIYSQIPYPHSVYGFRSMAWIMFDHFSTIIRRMKNGKLRHSESTPMANSLIQKLLKKTHFRLAERRYDSYLERTQLPQKYTQFVEEVGTMAVQEHSPKMLPVFGHISQPDEASPMGLHYPVPQVGKRTIHPEPEEPSQSQIRTSKRGAKTSMTNKRFRPSIESTTGVRNKSRRMQSDGFASMSRLGWSRRKIEKPKLIPLPEEQQGDPEWETKVTQMRQRKIKYEQALRVFKSEERVNENLPPSSNRKGEGSLNFTTDFKGKVINFSPRGQHMKVQYGSVGVKVHTTVQSGREWGRVSQGKYLSHTSHEPEGSMFI